MFGNFNSYDLTSNPTAMNSRYRKQTLSTTSVYQSAKLKVWHLKMRQRKFSKPQEDAKEFWVELSQNIQLAANTVIYRCMTASKNYKTSPGKDL